MNNQKKECIQYVCAVTMIGSGMILAFLSFFLHGDVTDGVLMYIGEALVFAGGIFGGSAYYHTKMGEMGNRSPQQQEERHHE